MANETLGLLGRKVGMTQLFADDGRVIPVTVIQAGPCPILRVKTEASADGYNALQLGFGERKKSRVNKPDAGQFKACWCRAHRPRPRDPRRRGHRGRNGSGQGPLRRLTCSKRARPVDVCGTSKGRGFAGVMKPLQLPRVHPHPRYPRVLPARWVHRYPPDSGHGPQGQEDAGPHGVGASDGAKPARRKSRHGAELGVREGRRARPERRHRDRAPCREGPGLAWSLCGVPLRRASSAANWRASPQRSNVALAAT